MRVSLRLLLAHLPCYLVLYGDEETFDQWQKDSITRAFTRRKMPAEKAIVQKSNFLFPPFRHLSSCSGAGERWRSFSETPDFSFSKSFYKKVIGVLYVQMLPMHDFWMRRSKCDFRATLDSRRTQRVAEGRWQCCFPPWTWVANPLSPSCTHNDVQ